MALPVYSRQLWAGAVPPGTGPNAGPPSGYTWIVREIDLYQVSGSGNAATLVMSNPGMYLVRFYAPAPSNSIQWTGRLVMPYGATFSFLVSGSTANIWVSGYQLSDT